MSLDDDSEDVLARVDLHAWRVPPPAAGDRRAILMRALLPATPRRRPRTRWLVAAFALANAVIAAIVVIVLSHREEPTIVVARPAGGGSAEAQAEELLRRLEQEQHELEGRLAEVQQLRALVGQLTEKVKRCEQAEKHEPPPPPAPPVPDRCDEVSCVLSNYDGACCLKFKKAHVQRAKPPALPDSLDREAIVNGIAGARSRIDACGQQSSARGTVKVHVRVGSSGSVENVDVTSTPDPALGACVAAAVQKASFAPTQHGGAFSYPFVIGTTP